MNAPEEKYAEKIAKLIAKAESTNHVEEAEAFFAKAQELMTEYAITEAMLDQVRGVERDEIEQHDFTHGGYYAADKGNLSWVVIRANGCRGVYWKSQEWSSPKTIGGKSFKMWYEVTATGFRSDLNRVVMLDASLQLQMARLLSEWWKTEDRSWMSKTQNVRARQSFMQGFANGVSAKFTEATRAGREAAAKAAAARNDTTQEVATESVALVVRSRKDRVDDWMDQKYGALRSGRNSYRKTDSSAYGAGASAGRSADVGQSRLGNQKGLNR
jgi:hypothetical protein